MKESVILHVYASHNFLHMREMVPANEMVFNGFLNKIVSVRTRGIGFAADTAFKAAEIGPILNWFQLLKAILSRPSQTIVYHGGYWAKIWWVILFSSLMCKRQFFISWGGELLPASIDSFAGRIRFKVRDLAIRRCRTVIFLSESDYDAAIRSHPKLTRSEVIPYFNPRHTRRVEHFWREEYHKVPQHKLTFQIGNDASPANAHLDCFAQIDRFEIEKVLILPMSYGRVDDTYVTTVETRARSVRGAAVDILTALLSPDEFDNVIGRCDALITGSKNQRGLYSVYAYLSTGRPVFLPHDAPIRRDLIRLGFDIQSLEAITAMSDEEFVTLCTSRSGENVKKVEEYLGCAAIRELWSRVLGLSSLSNRATA